MERVALGEHPLERGVVPLDGLHGLVHDVTDKGLADVLSEALPAHLQRDPKDVPPAAIVEILGVGVEFIEEAPPMLLEGVGDVIEENRVEHHMLVLGGVHPATQGVGHQPKLSIVAHGGTRGLDSPFVVLWVRQRHLLKGPGMAVAWVHLTLGFRRSRRVNDCVVWNPLLGIGSLFDCDQLLIRSPAASRTVSDLLSVSLFFKHVRSYIH